MAQKWDGKSYGTPLGYKIFIYSIRFLGLRFAYCLLIFVSIYYYIFRKKSTKSTYDFMDTYYSWESNNKTKIGWLFPFKRIYRFGQVMIDRVAVYLGKTDFVLEQHGIENLEKIASCGGLIIAAHFGNWEAGLSMLKSEKNVHTNVAMSVVEGDFLQRILKQNSAQFVSIIKVDDSYDSMIQIKNSLEKNEIVALHGDRYFGEMKTMKCTFLGKAARFPIGPYIIAATMSKPICFVSVVKTKTKSYQLTCSPVKEYSWDRRQKKEEQILVWLREYVSFLEQGIAKYPEQWFNFYDFWEETS